MLSSNLKISPGKLDESPFSKRSYIGALVVGICYWLTESQYIRCSSLKCKTVLIIEKEYGGTQKQALMIVSQH